MLVKSKRALPKMQCRNTIGGKCSAGTSAKAACHRGAKSCFGSQRHGSVIRGKSRSLSHLFYCKTDLSRSCCMSIVGVDLPKCSHGTAWQNLPGSTAFRPPVNVQPQLPQKLTIS